MHPKKENDVKLRFRYIAFCMSLAGLVAGYAWAKVNFDYDHAVDFASYSTYAWMERDNSVEGQLPEHLLIRLRRVTEDVLADKGFEPAPAPPQTDLLLTYYFSGKEELQINQVAYSPYSPWGYGYWPGFNYGYTEVRSYTKGTLVLDIVDARTHKLVWMGVLEKEIQSADPPGQRIEKSITKLLKNFPPKK
jgi:hypothetical protein